MRAPAAVLILLLLLAGVRPGSGEGFDPSVVRMLRPDSSFLLGIEWRRALSRSPSDLLPGLATSGVAQIPGLAGLEKTLREDVDAVFLCGLARDLPEAGSQTPFLAVVKGRFDRASLRGWIQGRTELYRKVELWAPAKAQPPTMRVALVETTTLLFGTRREVIAAIDRWQAPAAPIPPGGLLERVADLASRHDLWLALEAPPGGFKGTKTGPAAMLDQLAGLVVGVSVADGFAAQADLRAKSGEGARSIADSLRQMLALASVSEIDSPESMEMLRKIQIAEESSGVRLSLSLTQAEVERLAQDASPGRRQPSDVAAQRRAPPPGPRVIRIVGQDQGVVEVPLSVANPTVIPSESEGSASSRPRKH